MNLIPITDWSARQSDIAGVTITGQAEMLGLSDRKEFYRLLRDDHVYVDPMDLEIYRRRRRRK